MNETTVEVTVHERIEAEGYVVRLKAVDSGHERITKMPVDDFDEAAALAESIARYLNVGGDLDAFFPASDQGTATDTQGAP